MAHSELVLFLGTAKVGHLIDAGAEDWRLVYEPGVTPGQALSLRFPVRQLPYSGKDVVTYFQNLLPTGDLKRRVVQQLGFTVGNDFALTSELCHEMFGAFRAFPPGLESIGTGDTRELNDAELRNILAAMAINPMLTRVEGYRFSLSGEHVKLAIQVDDERMYLPLGHQWSTHIVKPAYPDRRESLENEAFCMSLAKAVGMQVANTVFKQGPSNYLLIERFDRTHQDGEVKPYHAEDFNQVMLLPPERAFQREGGLSAAECVQVLRDYSVQPAADIKQLLRWLVFNFLIGNGHASAKQLALLYGDRGPRLSPFFGLSSTHVYAEFNPNLAMAIGHEERPDWLIPNRWREFAELAGIRPQYVLQQLEAITVEVVEVVRAVESRWQQENGYAAITGSIRQLIERRARQLVVSLQAEAA